jgi:hypothetical protein
LLESLYIKAGALAPLHESALSDDYSFVEKRMTEQKLDGVWMFWRSIQPVKESMLTVG